MLQNRDGSERISHSGGVVNPLTIVPAAVTRFSMAVEPPRKGHEQ